jgi:hypothetical protein
MSDANARPVPKLAKYRMEHHALFDSCLLLFYTGLVYVWGLWVHPMGRDYAALANRGEDLPFLADRIFAWEVATFGGWVVPYHLVNAAVLYACVWCVMHLTNYTIRGLWWFGTWAAAVFMANPVHTESVLNISGIGDLVPAFFALLALTAYAYHAYRPRRWTYAASLVAFAMAVAPYPRHAFLFLVIVLFEILITKPEHRRFSRLLPYVAMGIAAIGFHWQTIVETSVNVRAWFAPLYFTFYSIGFLPENAVAMRTDQWIAWVAAVAVAVVFILIYRKARRPAMLFAVLGMFVVRLFPSERIVDPVHLTGGGELVLASALFSVGCAALFYRCMDHPKWAVPMVGITTAIAFIAVLVQIRAEMNWVQAARTVKMFQAAAGKQTTPIGVLPDWQHYRGAPLQLSESIRYDTPFSTAIPHESVLKLNAIDLDTERTSIVGWRATGGTLRIEGARVVDVIPWPYERMSVGDTIALEHGSATIGSADDGVVIEISGDDLPTTVLPAIPSRREEPREQSQTGAGDEEARE